MVAILYISFILFAISFALLAYRKVSAFSIQWEGHHPQMHAHVQVYIFRKTFKLLHRPPLINADLVINDHLILTSCSYITHAALNNVLYTMINFKEGLFYKEKGSDI